MIYPFPSYQNLGIRPVISCFSLFTLLLLCDIGSCRRGSPGSPAPQLTDLRSQITGVEELLEEFRKQLQQQRQQQEPGHGEDEWQNRHKQQHGDAGGAQQGTEQEEEAMQQELKEVGVRPSGDIGEDLCNFNHLQDYIIRTKDSLEAGATFLKAPAEVYSWKQCLEVCCSQASCSAAVVERSARGLSCFLFDCTHRGRNVCQFSPHRDYSSYTLTVRNTSSGLPAWAPLRTLSSSNNLDSDKPPISNAGQDVVLQLPVDWVILDGRESSDDHAIILYEWTLLRGDPLVDLKVPQPGTLRLSHLQEGVYTLQLTVTDTSGQKSSDNVSVSVLPAEHPKSASSACTGVCSRYQFICDDGCCIDITLACDRLVQCPDGSDEAFCQNFSSGRKTVVHISENMDGQANKGHAVGMKQNSAVEKSRAMEKNYFVSANTEKNLTLPQGLHDNTMLNTGTPVHHTTLETMDSRGHLEAVQGTLPSKINQDTEDNFLLSKNIPEGNGHPVPETGAVLPLALGLAITSLLLLMVVCRLQLVRQKLKKARPLTSEESDYLINGMYL